MSVRTPTVAGSFYPASPDEINRLIDRILDSEKEKIDYSFAEKQIVGCVVPHAGYVYSAYEAVHFFETIRESGKIYDTFLIVNPNHTGYGEYIEVDASDAWETPYGSIPLDRELAAELDLPRANRAQQQEHSAEVMLPLLQKFIQYDFSILPVSMLRQNPESALSLAKKIKEANSQLGRRLMIIASSDFSHFESPDQGMQKDDLVLEQIEKQDTEKLYEAVIRNHVSVCGYGPIMALIEYAKLVCEKPGSSILARGNSGKTRPSDSVVDYITILFYESASN